MSGSPISRYCEAFGVRSRCIGAAFRYARANRRTPASRRTSNASSSSVWLRVCHAELLLLALIGFGCASANVNPSAPRPRIGYVDFYSEGAQDVCWGVEQFDDRANDFRKIFYDARPVEGRILRLALAPGHYRLRVTILNRVIAEPALIELDIQDARITPVQIQLTEAGPGSVSTKQTSAGGTVYGRYGRRTKIGSYETATFRLTGVIHEPQRYELKEHMSYASSQTN